VRQQSAGLAFFADEDYRFDLDWLTGYAGKTGRQIHAHVLMTIQVHLLISANWSEAARALMKAISPVPDTRP